MNSLSIRSIALVLSLSLPFSGCSMFRSPTEEITVTTDQPDTQIFINGMMAGTGIAKKRVPRNKTVSILAKKDGFISMQKSVGKSLSNTGILDIIGGAIVLFPFFGLLAPGAFSLDQNHVSITMIKDPNAG